MPIVPGPKRGIAAMYQQPRVQVAVDFIAALRLELPKQPVDEDGHVVKPELPADITRISNEQVGRLYGQFTAVANYAEAQLGLADIEHADVDNTAEATEAVFGLNTDGGNADERKFALRITPQVKDAKLKALEKRARKVLLTKLLNGYERAANALSREMSRRGLEMEHK